jgi:hypothetical protein
MIFLSFFALPLLIALFFYIWFGRDVSFKEFVFQIVVQALLVGIICAVIYHKNTMDFETWNARVGSKSRDVVSCSHSYPCNCRSVSCGKNCTTMHCDTCHMHSYDVDWNVRTTINEQFDIDRIDLQGVGEPPRWSAVKIGEPTSREHFYQNYIKASPDSIFRTSGVSKEQLPGYPGKYYDYYRLDRLVQFGISVPDVAEWNKELAELNADLGALRQANVVVVLVRGKGRAWFKDLERSWIGGKKNDIVLVIGLNQDDTISWTENMAWSDRAYFKVRLRDEVQSIGKLDRTAILGAIRADVGEYYKRRPMSDFKYLMASVTPSTTEYTVGLILGAIVSILLGWLCKEQDVFGDEEYESRWFAKIFGTK